MTINRISKIISLTTKHFARMITLRSQFSLDLQCYGDNSGRVLLCIIQDNCRYHFSATCTLTSSGKINTVNVASANHNYNEFCAFLAKIPTDIEAYLQAIEGLEDNQ